MTTTPSTPSAPQIWMLAARPKTLPAAAAATVVGTALAVAQGVFRPGPALACLLAALLLQVGANLANDLFDYQRGADTSARLGPLRVTQAGLLSPAQVRTGMFVVFGTAAVLGLYLIWTAGWPVLLMGLASILAALAYTGGPLPYGYYGLGDLMVFIFFGPIAVIGTYYTQALAAWQLDLALPASIPMGLLIVAILVINNLRDIDTDRQAGKHTLAVKLGPIGARAEFILCVGLAYLSVIWIAAVDGSAWPFMAWLSIPLAVQQVRLAWTQEGRPLNYVLAGVGQLTLTFGILLSLGLIL